MLENTRPPPEPEYSAEDESGVLRTCSDQPLSNCSSFSWEPMVIVILVRTGNSL